MGWYYCRMSHRRLWAAGGIIALAIIAGFMLSVPHTQDAPLPPSSVTVSAGVPTVVLRDVYKKGVHTITGSLLAPNACGTVSATATATDEPGIVVAISLEADEGVCLQIPTRAPFSTTVAAPQGVPITATVNGAQATTTAS